MKRFLITVASMLAAASAWSAAPDIKGITPGMSEQALVKAQPKAKCIDSSIGTRPAIKIRSCTIKGFTVAEKPAEDVTLLLRDDKLISLRFKVYSFHRVDLEEALASKFGPFERDQPDMAAWKLPDGSRMWLADGGSSGRAFFDLSTPAYYTMMSEQRAAEKRAGKADL
ncbi:MAG: hypothetical protein JSR68_08370 [Proteobacteria bacterium]|nr:hypothetical protein [Pseudomonadota bacterium]